MYSLIIVDFNSIRKTVEYIEACKSAMGEEGSSHVVIVQNGDPTLDLDVLTGCYGQADPNPIMIAGKTVLTFRSGFQTIAYCASNENLGYAKGNNLAATIAFELWNDPYYIISNNDLAFSEKLDLQIANQLFDNNPDIGIIGPQVVTPEGEIQSPRRWISAGKKLIASYWLSGFSGIFGSRFRSRVYDQFGRDIAFQAESDYYAWVAGCFMIIRAKAFHDAGMFDEHTFLYAEEPILAKRFERIQSRVYFCRELKVIHAHGATTANHLKMMQMNKIDFMSNYYLYKTYMHTSPVVLFCSKLSFRLFMFLLSMKAKLHRRA